MIEIGLTGWLTFGGAVVEAGIELVRMVDIRNGYERRVVVVSQLSNFSDEP